MCSLLIRQRFDVFIYITFYSYKLLKFSILFKKCFPTFPYMRYNKITIKTIEKYNINNCKKIFKSFSGFVPF